MQYSQRLRSTQKAFSCHHSFASWSIGVLPVPLSGAWNRRVAIASCQHLKPRASAPLSSSPRRKAEFKNQDELAELSTQTILGDDGTLAEGPVQSQKNCMSRVASVKRNILSSCAIGHDSHGNFLTSEAVTSKGTQSTRKLIPSLRNGRTGPRVILGTSIGNGLDIARSHTNQCLNYSSLPFRGRPGFQSGRLKAEAEEHEDSERSGSENDPYSRRRVSRSRDRTETGAAPRQKGHKDTKRKARTKEWTTEENPTLHRHRGHLKTNPRYKVTSETGRQKHQFSHGLNVRSSKKEQPDDRKHEESEQAPKEPWQVQKAALKKKFGGEAWNPRKRLSPDALEGIRALHNANPEGASTSVLAEQFQVSPEVIRRILKSKWRPSEKEAEERRQRWDKRGEKIWSGMVKKGIRPPKKWREMGIGKAEPGQKPKWKQRKDKRLDKKQRFGSHQHEDKMLDSDDTPNSSISHRIL